MSRTSSEVYTCTNFLSRLPSWLQRHPTASALMLQLTPPQTGANAQAPSTAPRAAAPTLNPHVDWMADSTANMVTFYAILLRHKDDGEFTSDRDTGEASSPPWLEAAWSVRDTDPRVVASCTVVGHASHLTLPWCARLQHALSVRSLLSTATPLAHHGVDDEQNASSLSLSPFVSDGRGQKPAGVSALVVRLAPFVPPLQWLRSVDGVLGSHHHVSFSHACALRLAWAVHEDGDGAAWSAEGTAADAATRTAAAPAVAAAAADNRAAQGGKAPSPLAPPPPRRFKHEDMNSRWAGGTSAATSLSSLLPFRVAAVLNGNVPLPSRPHERNGICVLCLVAQDGYAVTGDDHPAVEAAPSLLQGRHTPGIGFRELCTLVAQEVMPRVELGVVDGSWERDTSSSSSSSGGGALLSDVCRVRHRLGCTFHISLPPHYHSVLERQLQSVTFVLDFSTALMSALFPASCGRPGALSNTNGGGGANGTAVAEARSVLTAQLAAAVQDVLGRLVAANVDVFSFVPRHLRSGGALSSGGAVTAAGISAESMDEESALPAAASGAAALLTREMLCRSIAESVSRIVSLSRNEDFKAEVVRLLTDTGLSATAPATGNADSARSRATVLSAAAIQRKLEERLLESSAQ